MNIKRDIIFALEARKKNGVAITENVPIRMRVNYSGQRIEFTILSCEQSKRKHPTLHFWMQNWV